MLRYRGHAFAFSRRVSPEPCRLLPPLSQQGRREGRAPAGTRSPACAKRTRTGWTTGDAGRPAFPARWFSRCPSCSPRGALHYCPRRLADDRCARRLAATSPQDLTPEPRASGPHDFCVRARPRWVLHGWRALTVETMRRRCQRRVVSHLSLLTVSRPASDHCAPTPSRPPHPIPRSVTIAIRPLVEWNRTGT